MSSSAKAEGPVNTAERFSPIDRFCLLDAPHARGMPPCLKTETSMCSYIVEKASLVGSAKGPNGWMKIDCANVYFDHPYHAQLDHALGIDFVNSENGTRVAVELSAESARALVKTILTSLESGEKEHAA